MTEKSRICLCAVVALNAAILAVGCNRSPQAQGSAIPKARSGPDREEGLRARTPGISQRIKVMPKDAEPHYQLGLAYLAIGQCGEWRNRAPPRDGTESETRGVRN